MLQQIRDRAQSWIAFAIVGMLIIGLSTVAWDAYFSPDPEVPVAKVNGENISSNEFQRAYANQRARLQQMLGDTDISSFIPDEDEFKKNILNRLEDDKLVLQAALASGFSVSDGLLAQQIGEFEIFQTDGKFDKSRYDVWLSQNFMNAGQFEQMLRRDVLMQQYRLAVSASGWTTEQEVNKLLALQEQQRDIAYFTIPVTNYLDQIEVSDADAQSHYDANNSSFATDEMVSLEYLELKLAEISKDVDVDEAKLEELYQDRALEFGVPEERHTRHILIEVAGDAAEDEITAAREKAESLLKQIGEGTSFEELARENSDDLGSAADGGSLGFMGREMMMDPAYADAAFALKEDEVSEVVKSAYGFHLIKLDAIKSGHSKPFEEVRATLEQDYRRNLAEDQYFERGEILANLTFENPDTLEIAATELGLKVQTTELFSRSMGNGLALDNTVRSTAFSEEVLLQGLNSQPIELAGDRVVVVRVKEHQESSVRPFDEVKQQIIQQLRQDQAKQKAKEEGESILEALAKDPDIEALAKARNLELKHPELVKRNATDLNRDIVQKAFRMPAPEEQQVNFDGLVTSSGDYAVVALYAINQPDLEALEESTKETLKTQRERYYGSNELQAAMIDMRRDAEIIEYPENF